MSNITRNTSTAPKENLIDETNQNIYDNLKDNLEYLKIKYNVLINSDIVIREFTLTANDKEYKSFLIYI
ncbi:MAG: hypothetical protein IKP28_01150, partial [Clostridia bacterium]|nr:hypothetical protein [Clostridia bacterium]